MSGRARALRLAAASLAAPLLACATFSDPPRLGRRPAVEIPDADPLDRLEVSVQTGYPPGEDSWPHEPQPVAGLAPAAVQALRDTGWFSQVLLVDSSEPADLEMRIQKYRTSELGGLALTLFTFGIVPSETSWRLGVTLARADGASCTRSASYRTWVGIFLLPFSFTRSQGHFERRAVERLTLGCLYEVLAKAAP